MSTGIHNPGVPQQFIKFGSTAHIILKLLHELGDLRQIDIIEETGLNRHLIAITLIRLRDFKFIFPVGKIPQADSGDKTQTLWSLKYRPNKRYRAPKNKDRTRASRHNRRMRVTSVFNLPRGFNIPITQGEPA
jgi:hypothetical protein